MSELHAERLDRSRPMWMAYLIDGLDDGRFAFYVKMHHTVIDGIAGLRRVSDALTTDPKRRSMRPFYATKRPEPPGGAGATSRGGNIVPDIKSLVPLTERSASELEAAVGVAS